MMEWKELLETVACDLQVREGAQAYDSQAPLKEQKQYLQKEVRKMFANKGEKLFRLTLWMRLREYYPKNSLMWLFATLMYKKEYRRSHVQINCPVGKGFHVVHESYSYLNAESIGDYFTVYQGVTLGVDGQERKPVIGNHVTVYTNAVISGGIRIGDHCVIGANAFVNHDLPDHSVVIASSIIKQRHTSAETD